VKIHLLVAVSAFALASVAAPAEAQHMHMPGMTMASPKKVPAKKPAAKKPGAKKPAANTAASTSAHRESQGKAVPMDHRSMQMPQAQAPSGPAVPMEHQHTAEGQMPGMTMPVGEHAAHGMAMTGALGAYPAQREASGTAWQPDTSEHMGLMSMSDGWSLMAHGVLSLVYDHQSSKRGDDKAFASGMLMGMARRPLGNGTIQFKAMVSPDPLMGPGGYPLLLASGETANGRDRLIDRQHPHDFFMELSGSVSQNIGRDRSVFLYAALPGEPAFGPPAFMHREAILDTPEAPISHHWLDSTHISFGVLTGGVVVGNAKVEVSRFNGREPDQHRWNIETGPLDSTSLRVSWNPTRELAVQGSWAHFEDPEELEPGVDQKRWSASALYARELAPGWKFAGTLAWGRKTVDHHGQALSDDAYVAEASVKHRDWTVFGRGEVTQNRELVEGEEHGQAYRVGKASLGAVRDFRIAKHLSLGAGGLLAVNFIPEGLRPLYGATNPIGAMGFVRLKLD